MNWNYRVVRDKKGTLAFHEVFYSDAGEVLGHTESEVTPAAETVDELREVLELFREALDKPVLEYRE
jgi:hypothetical protein